MRDWMNVAGTLQGIRRAEQEFVLRSLIEGVIVEPALDRVVSDISKSFDVSGHSNLHCRLPHDDES